MGAWGAGIFANDVACDVRDEYRGLLEEKVPDVEATRRVIDSWKEWSDDPDVWLGLAATQWKLGRLDPEVKERALAVIDEGRGLDLWEGPVLGRRVAALAKLRDQLVSPQPPRRAVRRTWRYETDLKLGDVIAAPLTDQLAVALRVVEILDARLPIFQVLPWGYDGLPSIADLENLPPVMGSGVRPFLAIDGVKAKWPTHELRVGIFNLKRGEPDWGDVGFVLIGNWTAEPQHTGMFTGLGPWRIAIEDLASLIDRATS